MWYLVKYTKNNHYGVVEAPSLTSASTRVCRAADKTFSVQRLSELAKIVADNCCYGSFDKWLAKANCTILESFESDNPLTDLPKLFPEYYL